MSDANRDPEPYNGHAAVRHRVNPLLVGLLTTSVVVSFALGWSGLRLVRQQRDLDQRLVREQVEATADAMVARIRERLAALGESLGVRVASPNPSSSSPPRARDLIVAVSRGEGVVEADSGLPFVPRMPPPPPAPIILADGERAEFAANDPAQAAAIYAQFTGHEDASVRASALLRLGRVLRKAGSLERAIRAYEELARLATLPTDTTGVPAELVALDGQRLVFRQQQDAARERAMANTIRERLDRGAWRLTRGTAEFYRDEVSSDPRPDSWQIATAIADTWPTSSAQLPTSGSRLATANQRPVLVLWRASGSTLAVGAGFVDELIDLRADVKVTWQLVGADERMLIGSAGPSINGNPVSRIIGADGLAWTLRAWPGLLPGGVSGRGPVLATAFVAMLAFVWGATYLMARAIRRESAVARLQSDFVAAVSHEFRSPLSTMRQMTEMLESDRVPSDARRHQYYGVLSAETVRLQRLVETLLNFGRLEAGRTPYRFSRFDCAALVRSVIAEVQAEPDRLHRRIVLSAADHACECDGDENAIRLAVRNLLDNAIKYSPSSSPVKVVVSRTDCRVAVAVADEGPGISSDEKATIFRQFVRGRAAEQSRIPGTGVGLAMVQRIAAAHGGEIQLVSEVGEGSTFTLLLPMLGPPKGGHYLGNAVRLQADREA